jgi:flagellar assembly protein FliH
MSNQGTVPPRNMKKFLFDVHNFDGNDDEETEEVPVEVEPPPPAFSLDELNAAKAAAYEQGKQDGLREALTRIEQHTADVLSAIRDHFAILFDAEDRRSRTFEKESVQLSHTIFAKAFPALNRRFGMDDVKVAITNILETMREQPEILIDVPPDYVTAIQHHIDGLFRQEGGPRCTIRGNDALGPGQCKMAWVNGSAMRNGTQLADQIREQIEHVLADKANLTDNGESSDAQPSHAAAPDHGEPS